MSDLERQFMTLKAELALAQVRIDALEFHMQTSLYEQINGMLVLTQIVDKLVKKEDVDIEDFSRLVAFLERMMDKYKSMQDSGDVT